MQARAAFTAARRSSGMYESFYLRAVSPAEPIGVWLRYTVHKRPQQDAAGSVWCTVFDASRGAPFMHRETAPEPRAPSAGWVEILPGTAIGPAGAEGRCGPASWSLRFTAEDAPLMHLRPRLLYRMTVPRTKLTSPAPLARIDGVLELPGRSPIELRGWPGMIGHNWGAEHAERWIWLHGCAFEGRPGSWLDVAAGRIEVGGRTTPWVLNGAVSLDGRRVGLGGLLGPRPDVEESAAGCSIALPGRRGSPPVRIRAGVPPGTAAAWRYADPNGGEHDVVNCSIAALSVELGGERLETAHGGAFELGLRELHQGVPAAPFPAG